MRSSTLLLIFIVLMALQYSKLQAQVGIGTTTPNPSSILDISSTKKGLLIPRVNITDLNNMLPITEAAETGLLVFNTNTVTGTGFYYWTGSQWNRLTTGNETSKDWFKERTTSIPTSIDDNIYTNGKVAIGRNSTYGALYLYEPVGAPGIKDGGTLTLAHGNNDGESSIVFRSTNNPSSDFAYLKYNEDGSGNGSTIENGLLTIGIENDTQGSVQDDINIASSGSLGINNSAPNGSASLDMGQNDRGLLINRVALTALNDINTIVGTEPDGLLIYNTATAGISGNEVAPGFYFWKGSQWNRLVTGNETSKDWFKEGTTNIPESINDNIWTNGEVGLGLNSPNAPLHIFEAIGTPASATDGSLILEHNDNGGESSIVFKSKINTGSDFAYIKFSEDGSSNGSNNQNGLLTIGIENDGINAFQDDINISSSGIIDFSVGNNTRTYTMSPDALLPVGNNTQNLGGTSNHWDDLFISGEIRSADGNDISVTLHTDPDYNFNEDAFYPLTNRTKELGLSGNRWKVVYTDTINYRVAVAASDRRLKKNIINLEKGLKTVKKIKTHQYNYKSDTEEKIHYGVIAQELREILPALVHEGNDTEKTLSVNYIELIPILINAIKEQQATIEDQDSKIGKLEIAVAEIRQMFAENSAKQMVGAN